MTEGPIIGRWCLVLAVVEPGNTAIIDVRADPLGGTEPRITRDETGFTVASEDGQITTYPWSALASACYTPTAVGRA